MRPTRPDRRPAPSRGVTLIEMVVVILLLGILIGATVYFLYPVTQSVDLKTRAELTDIADNTLQRIGRDVRLALPNSVRVATSGGASYLEFIPIRSAGRYRAASGGISSGADCPDTGEGTPASDQLSFAPVLDTCFKTIGLPQGIGVPPDVGGITTRDFLVFNNYGTGFTDQDAYASAGNPNRRQISAVSNETTRLRIAFTSATNLDAVAHDSPGKRFFVVVGRATGTAQPEPVSYVCVPNPAGGTITRYWGYDLSDAQPTSFAAGNQATIAADVTSCSFDYAANVSPQVGLLTMQLELSRTLTGGVTQRVTLYHGVHVSNVP